jgi:O-antigen/teichoic acid export membrane protein
MQIHLIRRTREFLAEPLNRTSIPVMAATVLTAALGVPFWALATRLFGPAEVGRDGALITSMMAIATICDLSMNNLVVRFLPQMREKLARRVLTAYAVAGGTALIGATIFTFVAGEVSDEFWFFAHDSKLRIFFILSVGFWSVFVTQDAVLAGAGKASWLPGENGSVAAAKIVVIIAASAVSVKYGIFVGWVLPLFIVVPVVNWLIFTRVLPELRARTEKAPRAAALVERRKLFRFIGHDVGSTVINQTGTTALPIIVVGIIGPAAAAYFVVPFVLITALDALYVSVVVGVMAESARDISRVPEIMAGAWKRLTHFTTPLALTVAVAAPLFLIPNGRDYMENAAWPLRLMALACIPHAVIMLYGATLRVRGRGRPLLTLQVLNVAVTLGAVFVLADKHGATGAAAGWLIGMSVSALLSIWPLWTFLRDPHVEHAPPSDDLFADAEEEALREVH